MSQISFSQIDFKFLPVIREITFLASRVNQAVTEWLAYASDFEVAEGVTACLRL